MAVQVRGEFEVRVKEKGPLGLTMEPLTAPGLTNFASSLPHITAAAGQSADAFENGLPSLSADGKCCVIVGIRVRFGRSVRYVGLKSYEQWMRIVGQRVYANQVAGSVDTFAKLVCGYYAEDWGDSNSDSESDSSGASTSAMQCEQQDDDEVDDADAMQNEQQDQVNSDDSNEATSKDDRNSNCDDDDANDESSEDAGSDSDLSLIDSDESYSGSEPSIKKDELSNSKPLRSPKPSPARPKKSSKRLAFLDAGVAAAQHDTSNNDTVDASIAGSGRTSRDSESDNEDIFGTTDGGREFSSVCVAHERPAITPVRNFHVRQREKL